MAADALFLSITALTVSALALILVIVSLFRK